MKILPHFHVAVTAGPPPLALVSVVYTQAAGSSLLAKLCNILVQDALGMAGMLDVGAVTVLPVATGMALTLTLLAMKTQRPATARQDARLMASAGVIHHLPRMCLHGRVQASPCCRPMLTSGDRCSLRKVYHMGYM